MSPRLLILFLLCTVPLFARAEPVISEFLASNQGGATDEDGSRPDWIEIQNPDSTPVNMSGWFLTDAAGNLQKWAFPAVIIPAKGYLLVFASGKNRRIAGQNLHTNFELSAAGEYLALVRPDGVGRSTEFAPAFPAQYPDVSYGTASSLQTVLLAQKGTLVRALVPPDNTLGTTWRQRLFDDGQWLSGGLAVGYFNHNSNSNPDLSADLGINVKAQVGGLQRSVYIRVPFEIENPASIQQLQLRMNYDDGFAAWINGNFADSGNSPAVGSLAFNSLATGLRTPGSFQDFDISSQIAQLQPGTNVLAIQGLNRSASSSDLFLLPELIARIETGSSAIVGYFTVATPGAPNGGPETIQLPQRIAFSRAPGTFKAPFELALSGAAAGQQIRYTTGLASQTARANVPEPTTSSTLYIGPIPVDASVIIRAAIFDEASGQKSPTATAQYLLLETAASNNTSNFTSNLPILVADNHGAGQPVDSSSLTYTTGLLYVFDRINGVAALDREPTLFTRAGTRVRGSSSGGFAKKSYGMELWDEQNAELDHPILGLAPDADWVLNGPFSYDRTYIHNAFAYEISRRIGQWAPRTVLTELFYSSNGGKLDYADYAGIYVLTEKIRSSNARLNIEKIRASDNSGDALTGGYIFKIDRADSNEVSWTTVIPGTGTVRVPNGESGQRLVIVEPDPRGDTQEQIDYLKSYVQSFDTTLFNERAANFSTRNYLNFINRDAWVDHHIVNSICYNVDGLRLSAFYHKDRLGKISAGPAWDFDRSLGGGDRDTSPQSWNNIGYYFTRDWWGPLFQDPDFVQAWVDRWWRLRAAGQPLHNSNLQGLIDSMAAEIGNAAAVRDATRWTQNASRFGNYQGEINNMKSWMGQRTSFIDAQTPAPPAVSVASGVVAAGTNVTLSGSGTIRYTLNGADPRPPGGAGGGSAPVYSGAIPINQTTVLTARRTGGFSPFPGATSISWSAVETRVYLVNEAFAVAGDLAVSEIHYNPLEPTAAESAAAPGATADDFQFIELKNIGARNINLFEVKFSEGRPFAELTLAPLTLTPGATTLVVKNRAAFEARYGSAMSGRIAGEWGKGVLANGGEAIELLARGGSQIQLFSYSDGRRWPLRADGRGFSLEYTGVSFLNTAFNAGENWRASSEIHGSPGFIGSGPDSRIVINELLTNATAPRVDAIELYNTTGEAIDVSGWWLSNEKAPETAAAYHKFRIPDGTVIPPFGFRVFTEVDFNPNGDWNINGGPRGPGEFSFDGNRPEEAWLLQSDAGGAAVKFIDHAQVSAARPDESFGRWPNGAGRLYPMLVQTLLDESSGATPRPGLGAANSAPRVGPVIISEVQHSPVSGDNDLEFIEIFNTGAAAESLDQWRLRGAVDFDFTASHTLAPGAFLVIVPFAPSDAAKAAAFRATYGIGASVPLAGPWSAGDNLGRSERVVIYRAGTPPPEDSGYFPLISEDETNYGTGAPWPAALNGLSLNRRSAGAPGEEPHSWKADAPSPGAAGPAYAQWRAHHFAGGGSGTGDDEDYDSDGASNALEYTRGTDPRQFEDHAPFEPVLVRSTAPGGDAYVFTYSRPTDRTGAQYRVQTSPDLVTWTDVADALVSSDGEMETREAVVPIDPATDSEMFFRLRVLLAQ